MSYSWKQYISNVVGHVTNVGRSIQQRTCFRNLNFYLANKRGQRLRVTLLGEVWEMSWLKRRLSMWASVVHESNVRLKFVFNLPDKLYLSSSSSTLILDDADIPALKELRSKNRTRKGWNFPTCGGDKCKKGVCKKLKGWWCNACDQEVAYPVLRFNLELGVSDETTHVVVVMFDETASELVKCSADSIAQAKEESLDETSDFLAALTNIIGSTHTLELKSHTYYEHGTFESFTCWKLHSIEAAVKSAGSSIIDATTNARRSSRKRLCMHPFVLTPLKPSEEKKRIRLAQNLTTVPVNSK
ncbi:nucleic acid-binding, OB-fold protein [Tanacetum coccineum]